MTSHEYDILNNMIDDYTKTHKFDSVTKLLSEINDGYVIDFLDILPRYNDPEKIISHLRYIRDQVVQRDCGVCVDNEKTITEKEKKTLSEL